MELSLLLVFTLAIPEETQKESVNTDVRVNLEEVPIQVISGCASGGGACALGTIITVVSALNGLAPVSALSCLATLIAVPVVTGMSVNAVGFDSGSKLSDPGAIVGAFAGEALFISTIVSGFFLGGMYGLLLGQMQFAMPIEIVYAGIGFAIVLGLVPFVALPIIGFYVEKMLKQNE